MYDDEARMVAQRRAVLARLSEALQAPLDPDWDPWQELHPDDALIYEHLVDFASRIAWGPVPPASAEEEE
jgi:hypothetical protein